MKREINLSSLEASNDLGLNLGAVLKGGEVIALASDLGGGKTTLIKSIVHGTGSRDTVSSPTFTICNLYKSPKFNIYHFDFYRLSEPGVIRHELMEAINEPGSLVLIEWPKLIESALPERRINISIKVTGEDSRTLTVEYPDEFKSTFDRLK